MSCPLEPGATRDEVVEQMREAIEFHLEELRRATATRSRRP